jgi:hypothetical protein
MSGKEIHNYRYLKALEVLCLATHYLVNSLFATASCLAPPKDCEDTLRTYVNTSLRLR